MDDNNTNFNIPGTLKIQRVHFEHFDNTVNSNSSNFMKGNLQLPKNKIFHSETSSNNELMKMEMNNNNNNNFPLKNINSEIDIQKNLPIRTENTMSPPSKYFK